jgi:hypothetical protein
MTLPPTGPAFPSFASFPGGPHWSTASFGDAAHPSPLELSALGDHLDVCRGLRGRLFAARCRAEVVQGFVASHLVTTVLGAAALSAVVWRVL